MATKMTAVEWLRLTIQNKLTSEMGPYFEEAFEQAKAMERQQIKEAYIMGWMTREYKPIKTEANHSQFADGYLRDIYGL
jgi:hypothetical protein